MNFVAARTEFLAAQRAVGRLALALRRRAGATRVQTFFQDGCLKARLPRPQEPGVCELVTLNISGGVAGGDFLSTELTLAEGARAILASQAAERIYRALAAPARIVTRLAVGAGATLEYLPQETILFDGFALDRRLEIELAADACFLGVESLVFGRRAMGEIVRAGWLRDRILLRRGQKLLFHDVTRLEGDIAARLARKGVADGAGCVATLIFRHPGAAGRLDAVRARLDGLPAGASMIEDMMLVRILADDNFALRRRMRAVLDVLRDGRMLPRVWQG